MEQGAAIDELRNEVRHLHVLLDELLHQNRAILDVVSDLQRHIGRMDHLEAELNTVSDLVRATDRDTRELERKVSNIKSSHRFL